MESHTAHAYSIRAAGPYYPPRKLVLHETTPPQITDRSAPQRFGAVARSRVALVGHAANHAGAQLYRTPTLRVHVAESLATITAISLTAAPNRTPTRRRLSQPNQPAASPTALEQPSLCCGHAWRTHAAEAARNCSREAIERGRRREWIETCRVGVLLVILKDIHERVADLTWAFQIAPVPAICPETPRAAQ